VGINRTGFIAQGVIAIGLILASAEWRTDVQSQIDRAVTDPPRLNDVGKALTPLLLGPGARPASSSNAALDLYVAYSLGQIWNPATDRYDRVNLRSYQGAQIDPQAPFVSPTIEVTPGDTIRLTLHNRLPADAGCAHAHDANTPHCFNGTNVHTHGLWINPNGNGDNVLISVNPGVSFQYEYNIPPDHPAGTYWYHTHRHGSTALQVSSGMAGALIVRGNRLPTIRGGGHLDTLLRPTSSQPFTERIVVMQQIQYACRDAAGAVQVDAAGAYRCDPGNIGSVESYDVLGPTGWATSGRYTSINGHVLPTFTGARAGQLERWRMIHAGVRDTINLQFRMLNTANANVSGLPASGNDRFIGENCTGPTVLQRLVAADGLTMGAIQTTDQTVFQPGYRWDALMMFPKPGTYCVIDAAAPAPGVSQTVPSRQLLGFVSVGNGYNVPDNSAQFVLDRLVEAAYENLPDQVRRGVIADLNAGLKLTAFTPHEDIGPNEVTGTQTLTFNIVTTTTPALFHVNDRPYDPARLDRVLTLGGVDEWTLKSAFVGHPFHIHVNPFQIIRILDPTGKDVSAPDAVDSFGAAGTPDPQFRGLRGVWKDTLWLKNATPNTAPPEQQPAGMYTAIVRTRYRRYIGDFVLHCHILDHEDQGMMQNIRVALPGAEGTRPQ
jgi:L-ascorbate oxidase